MVLVITEIGPELSTPGPLSGGPYVETDALIDPGAGRTVISPQAALKAGLPKVGQVRLLAAAGVVNPDVHAASLQFPRSGSSAIELIEVVCCELANPIFYCLIGRDVLSRWIFTYDALGGTWQISEGAVGSSVEPPEEIDLSGK